MKNNIISKAIKSLFIFILSILIFVIYTLYFGEIAYKIYADFFQNGQLYEGETKSSIYINFLLFSYLFMIVTSVLFAIFLYWITHVRRNKE